MSDFQFPNSDSRLSKAVAAGLRPAVENPDTRILIFGQARCMMHEKRFQIADYECPVKHFPHLHNMAVFTEYIVQFDDAQLDFKINKLFRFL